ncbi:HNH endonuclease family protein [Pseudonocardia sediminis]|uniref:HNH endonuclease family protein n=1 Tax=Pseudonocardia sediminis TaxID=1397368 RepID=UPI00102930EA|nr:HNH endonuclease family protein [Pseudonocardia sediminis]
MHGWRSTFLALTVSAALLPAAACGVPYDPPTPVGTSSADTVVPGGSDPTVEPAAARSGAAAAALAKLPVKGRAPKTGYTREQFGQRWADIDKDGCDQRNQVLARDMDKETFKPGTKNCVVLTGSLRDPYTARTIAFTRGADSSSDVQIDHVIALSDAWQKGAQQLDAATRQRIGNDPLNLVAVDGPTNARKGDGDAATWLVPNTKYRCAYVSRQVAVKARYKLWVTAAERDAIGKILDTCPGQALPTDANAPANTFR